MAATSKQQRVVVDKWKKKKEYTIMAPKLVGNVEIGHTVSDKDEKVIGRVTKANLGQLTNQFQKKKYDVYFRVNNIQASNAYTEMFALEMKGNFSRRLIGRRCNKLDIVQFLDTKDGQRLKVKSLCVTRRKVEKIKVKDISKELRKQIAMIVSKNSSDDVFDLVMNKDIEKDLISKVKNIAEIRGCAILLLKKVNKKK